MTDFLEQLNDAQRSAVTNTEGPSLVIAGAGAGKTRVLTYRIAMLLQKGVAGHSILALTFTNKAAKEMKERITHTVGAEKSRYLWMGTFHSIFSRILRADGGKLGYKENFTIYDSDDSKQVIRQIIKELNLDDKLYNQGQIASRISAAKNNLITPADYAANQRFAARDAANRVPLLGEIYKRYAARCFRANAMDFDDLLVNTNILFRDFPEILKKYRERFRYLLVDEYQDTNYCQYLIVKALASAHNNICVVGDDAQSIYSFRGARIENIFDFRNDFPDAPVFKLEQNYRSTQNIVNAANSIISRNEEQIRKTIFSENEVGDKIRVIEAVTDSEEGVFVASDIMSTHHNDSASWEQFAILYRTNAQSRIFEETLRKRGIPYRVYGGLSFYERKEIKDIMAWFRLVINPDDEEAFRRAIAFPRRGIGANTLGKLNELATKSGRSLWSVASDFELHANIFNRGICARLKRFIDLISEMSPKASTGKAFEMAREIAVKSGILKELREGRTVEDIARLENVEELMNGIQEFTENAVTNGEPATLSEYLAIISLITTLDRDDKEDNDKVTLMTAHSAKGLEFKYVYVTGMEENLFPSAMSSGTAREMEEERRLFYVALTRAMKRATLSYALNRYRWGNLECSSPSRFIREIEGRFITRTPGKPGKKLTSYLDAIADDREPGGPGHSASPGRREGYTPAGRGGGHYSDRDNRHGGRRGHFTRRNSGIMSDGSSSGNRSNVPQRDGAAGGVGATGRAGGGGAAGDPLSDTISAGDRVRHERFGMGEVISVEGAPPNTTAVVKFSETGTRKLLLRFAKLRRV